MILVLASASPRRKELLTRVGVTIDVCPAEVDESLLPGESAFAHVARLAAAKADAVARPLRLAGDRRWVLGADTIVEIDGDILGKAGSPEQAAAMLSRLVGRVHRVATAFALRGPDVAPGAAAAATATTVDRMVVTEVAMRPADAAEIADYVSAGEWRGKAGAYAVQGMAAGLVTEVCGSITNVIGLPLAEVLKEMARVGVGAPEYGRGVSS